MKRPRLTLFTSPAASSARRCLAHAEARHGEPRLELRQGLPVLLPQGVEEGPPAGIRERPEDRIHAPDYVTKQSQVKMRDRTVSCRPVASRAGLAFSGRGGPRMDMLETPQGRRIAYRRTEGEGPGIVFLTGLPARTWRGTRRPGSRPSPERGGGRSSGSTIRATAPPGARSRTARSAPGSRTPRPCWTR